MNERAIIDVLKNAGVPRSLVRRTLKSLSVNRRRIITGNEIKSILAYSPMKNNLKVIRACRELGIELDPMQKVILMQNGEITTKQIFRW